MFIACFADSDFGRGRAEGLQLLEQRWNVRRIEQQPAIFLVDKSIRDGTAELLQQRVVVALNVEQAARFAVDAELRPGDRFEKFFECPVAAGQGNEGVGQIGHACFALVHRADHVQLCESAVSDLTCHQRVRDYPDGFAAGRERSIGEHSHQANFASAENDANATFRQRAPEFASRRSISGAGTDVRSAEDANALQLHAIRLHEASDRMYIYCEMMYIMNVPPEAEGHVATTRRRRHKHFQLDPLKIKRAQRALHAKTETEAIERALDLAITEERRNRLALEANGRFLKSGIEIKDVYDTLGG